MWTTWRPERPAWWQAVHETLAFGWKEALACGFALFIFLCLGLTKLVAVPGVPRYDLLLLLCLAFQVALLRTGVETRDELKVITLFHALGLALELWKVHLGSWSYPGEAWTKVGGVPLFGGFMYASVGSFVAQSWRRLELRLEGAPPAWQAGLVCAGIYGNFFTNRHLPDVRWWLFLLVAVVFRRTFVRYRPCEGRPRAAHAAPGLVPPRGALRVVRRTARDAARRLALPEPAPRLAAGLLAEAHELVAADHPLHHARGRAPPAQATGPGRRAPRCERGRPGSGGRPPRGST